MPAAPARHPQALPVPAGHRLQSLYGSAWRGFVPSPCATLFCGKVLQWQFYVNCRFLKAGAYAGAVALWHLSFLQPQSRCLFLGEAWSDAPRVRLDPWTGAESPSEVASGLLVEPGQGG